MKKDFVTVIYDRRKRVEVTGEGSVELCIYLKRGERKYVALRLCTPVAWRKYQRSVELMQEVNYYRETIERMIENHEEMTIDNLNRRMGCSQVIKDKEERKRKLTSAEGFLDFIHESMETEKICPATIQRKRITIDALKRYGHLSSFADLTPVNVKGFDDFLRAEAERTLPTLRNYHKIVKMYTRLACQLGYIAQDPYDNPLCKFERGKYKERQPLMEEELVRLRELELNGKLARVRDLFVFCAYTGLSYADSQTFDYFTMTDKVGDHCYIDGKRVKTGCTYFTPILPPAVEVLERYDYQLPHISNQKANDYLHVVEGQLGLNKPLTMHVARHSFATLMLSYDIPIENVSRMCGHTNIRTTQVYAKILKKTIERHTETIFDKLK